MLGSPKNLVLSASIFFASVPAFAFMTPPGQIARFQSMMLLERFQHGGRDKAFKSTGTVTVGKNRLPYLLQWYGPGRYSVQIENTPKSFFRMEEGSGTWTLMRQGRTCVLKTEEMTVSCGGPNFWATLAFFGSPNASARALVDGGFFSDNDAVYAETDSRDTKPDAKDKRLSVTIGANGPKPAAVIQILGPSFSGEISGEEYPAIQYDQTFLTPLLARFKSEGDIYTIKVTADLEVRHGHTRYTYVLPVREDLYSGKILSASFVRQEPIALPNPTVPNLPKAITDVQSLRQNLSLEGQAFLKALLLTH